MGIPLAGQLTNVCHKMFKLMRTDGAPPILVECPECQPHHLHVIRDVHLVGHHVAELWELYLPRSICIILTTQILVQLITAFSWSCCQTSNSSLRTRTRS